MTDLEKRAKLALERLSKVKDPSIKAFMRTFVIDEKVELENGLIDVLKARFDQCLQTQVSLCRKPIDKPVSYT